MPIIAKKGDKAKEFTLKDQYDDDVSLSDFQGKQVILSFHPLAWTSVCADQMKDLEEHKAKFDSLNTIALGISIDTVSSKNAWAQELGIKHTKLLSDFWPHGKIAKAYGILRETNGFSERAVFVLNENHRVTFARVYAIKELPDIEEILQALI